MAAKTKTEEEVVRQLGYACRHCRYNFHNFCKRNPPLVLINKGAYQSVWAAVRGEDWCYRYNWCGTAVEEMRGLKLSDRRQ
jgi:hypothetical protein